MTWQNETSEHRIKEKNLFPITRNFYYIDNTFVQKYASDIIKKKAKSNILRFAANNCRLLRLKFINANNHLNGF